MNMAFFTSFSLLFYNTYTPYCSHFLILSATHTHSDQFHLLTLFQKTQNTLYWTHEVANRHIKTTTGDPFQTRRNTGYLIVQENNRTNNSFQDWRLPMIHHQWGHQHWGQTPTYPVGKLRVFWEFFNNLLKWYPVGQSRTSSKFAHHFDQTLISG